MQSLTIISSVSSRLSESAASVPLDAAVQANAMYFLLMENLCLFVCVFSGQILKVSYHELQLISSGTV